MTEPSIIISFVNAIAAIGYINIAFYIKRVQEAECECARDWRQKFTFACSILLAVIACVYVFVIASGSYKSILERAPYIEPLVIAITIVYMAVSYSYTRYLKTSRCVCSDGLELSVMYLIHFLNGLLVTFGVFTILVFLLFGGAAAGYFWFATSKS